MGLASHRVRAVAAGSFDPPGDSSGDAAERRRADGVWQFLSERVGVCEEMSFRFSVFSFQFSVFSFQGLQRLDGGIALSVF